MKYAYYPGCSLSSTGIEYDHSTRLVAEHLGVELVEIEDWNCCGATAAHNASHLLSIALPSRSLALAEKLDLDVTVPCAACFNRLKSARAAVLSSTEMRKTIEDIINMEYSAKNDVKTLPDVFVNDLGLERIKDKVKNPLDGLRVASYYGCLLVRPPKVANFDDPEDPQTLDNLVEALGGIPVDWSYKVECCGASHSTVKTDVGIQMVNSILTDAVNNNADCIITACPLCFINLDMRQSQINKLTGANISMPILYFTQLMGVAFNLPISKLGIKKHFVNPLNILKEKEVLK